MTDYREYYENIGKFANLSDGDTLAIIETSEGNIKLKLFEEKTPKTVKNFIELAKNGKYSGSKFHRVINEFMIQGGETDDGQSIYGSPFEDEFSDDLFNFRGAISMANTGMPVSNTTQFFIVQNTDASNWINPMKDAGFPADAVECYERLGGTPFLDKKHTVFGYVIDGMDVVDKIANVETTSSDAPVVEVKILNVMIDTYKGE